MRPWTKHIAVRMHHFREHVRQGLVTIYKVSSELQLADIATKPQPEKLFVSQRESLLQWESERKTKEEIQQPADHLRACEIIELALGNSLSGDQHAMKVDESQLEWFEDLEPL